MGTSRPTDLLVLGIGHLTAKVRDAALERALDRLRAWDPDAIAVELLPGELVDAYTHEGGLWDMVHVGGIDTARELGAIARRHRDWSRPEAARRARTPEPGTSPLDRALAWMIALEPTNALLVDTDPTREEVGLPADVRAALDRHAAGVGEVPRVAVPLARRLGLDRLHHFDDHAGLDLLGLAGEDWWERLETAGLSTEIARVAAGPEPPADAIERDIWPYWLELDTEAETDRAERRESGVLEGLAEAYPVNRIRLAQWRTRNLAMAARLRAVTAYAPGGRVLAIVGHAHLRPLRAALAVDQHDVHPVRLAELDEPR